MLHTLHLARRQPPNQFHPFCRPIQTYDLLAHRTHDELRFGVAIDAGQDKNPN